MSTFVERLRQAARYAGLGDKQSEIANALGLKRQTVNKWFIDGAIPETIQVVKIAERFSVSLTWLTTGNGAMLPSATSEKLSHDERRLILDYRSAKPIVRRVISAMARAARKVSDRG